jgi:diguanylate cyclase (GGDEF)-like protein
VRLSSLLNLAFSGLLLVVFAGNLAITAHQFRDQWAEQLAAHAQDTATALGLALGAPLASGDQAGIASLVDAIFDHGYYQSIEVRSAEGTQLLVRESPPVLEGVPAWLMKALPLPAPRRDAQIMAGWKKAATVSIASHPGYAYRALWQELRGLGSWLLMGWLLSSLLTALILRLLLSPIQDIESLALRIADRDFRAQRQLPRIRELRRVVDAMNRLAARFARLFSEYSQTAEALREEAYRDPLTGLYNRRYLLGALDELPHGPSSSEGGILALIRIDHFDRFDAQCGRNQADKLLINVAGEFGRLDREPHQERLAARLEGAAFALLCRDGTRLEAEEMMRNFGQFLADIPIPGGPPPTLSASFGLTRLDPKASALEQLERADSALREARRAAPGTLRWFDPPPSDSPPLRDNGDLGEDWLRRSLENRSLSLRSQPILSLNNSRVLHGESFARLPDAEGHALLAGAFLPLATRLGLNEELDRQVVKLLLPHLGGRVSLAANISPQALKNPGFTDWLLTQLDSVPGALQNLLVETTECGFLNSPNDLEKALRRLQNAGLKVGLDHFGARLSQFDYLIQWPPDYLKIDGTVIHRAHQDSASRLYLQSLGHLAHSLDIQVIATQVESEIQRSLMARIGLDGAQGRWMEGLAPYPMPFP